MNIDNLLKLIVWLRQGNSFGTRCDAERIALPVCFNHGCGACLFRCIAVTKPISGLLNAPLLKPEVLTRNKKAEWPKYYPFPNKL